MSMKKIYDFVYFLHNLSFNAQFHVLIKCVLTKKRVYPQMKNFVNNHYKL